MTVIWIAVAAFLGGIAAGLLGWLDSKEPFNSRKFGASAIRALIAGIGFAAAYQYTSDLLTPIDLAIAFLGGAGVDVVGHRISGSIKAGLGK